MADDDSRSEDAEKRPGKSSKPSKKSSGSDDAKAKAGKKSGKKDDTSDKSAKAEKASKSGKGEKAKADKPHKGDKDEKDTKAVTTVTKTDGKDDKPKKRRGPLKLLFNFLREIVEQMRKVVYPTRKQLLTYTAVVLVFVTIMIGIIYGLDAAMAKGVAFVFGGGDE